jgi:hypothetical protein
MKTSMIWLAIFSLSVLAPLPVSAAECSLDVSTDAKVTPLDARLILEKIAGECPVSTRKACDEICCDVDGDKDCDGDDASLVLERYMEATDETPSAVSLQADYLAKQYRAQQTLVDMVGRMRQYQSESGNLAETADDLGIAFKQEARFEYQIHGQNAETGEYKITATSKAPGIGGYGAEDEIWMVDQERRFTRSASAIPGGPKASCLPCYWDYLGVIDTLEELADLQTEFQSQNNRYANHFSELGWIPKEFDKYFYTIMADQTTYLITASSKAPGIMGEGAEDDIWTINQEELILQHVEACRCCDGRCPTNLPTNSFDGLLGEIPGQSCHWALARQIYAKETLQRIAQIQNNYFENHNTYTSDYLYWILEIPKFQRYDYTVEAGTDFFLARATYFGWEQFGMDEWTIDDNGILVHVQDYAPLCPGLTIQPIHSEAVLCDSLGKNDPCQQRNKGLVPRLSATQSELTLSLFLAAPNNLGAFGFEVVFNPEVLRFSSSSPESLAQSMDAFEVRETEPGRLRLGGYAMDFIPKGESGPLASLSFQVLTDGPLELDLINLTDHMNPWAERQISIPALSERNDLAEAIRILKILAGLRVDRDLWAPDIDEDGGKGLPEVVFLLQRVADLR